ncbi:hypothetical protein [Grimontia sp. SpTr1]|uniref:hypothetical protein n=1 Tax=Grimontia sp. SpTr1 TaxID=2995319 RepID=UPI00248CF2C6|nr:hypothetical protein [Grimontia sp. SpTr1]
MSALEAELAFQLTALGLPEPEREYSFHPTRRWRFDFAWPALGLAVEVEGGGWTGGRHTRGKGFEQDMTKYSEAMKRGWTVYRCDRRLIQSGEAVDAILQIYKRLSDARAPSLSRVK